MKTRLAKFAALCAFGLYGVSASAALIYSQDFETNSTGFSGATSRQGTQGYSNYGFGSQFWRNSTEPAAATKLTFNAAGSTGSFLDFDLALIDSWDSNNTTWGPDRFIVKLDGATLFDYTMPNPGGSTGGVTQLVSGVNLGFNSSFSDAAYHFSLNLGALSAGNHTITFSGAERTTVGTAWQGGNDESFGIDNVRISAVPEPGSLALFAAGILGFVATSRRRKV